MKKIIRDIAFKIFVAFGGSFSNYISEKLSQFAYFMRATTWYKTDVPHFDDRTDLYEFMASEEKLDSEKFTYLEFGVSKGQSLRSWVKNCKHPKTSFWGFDTFEGLPEAWGSVKKGAFSASGKTPDIDDKRIDYCVGLVDQTIPPFIEANQKILEDRLVIHLDLDLYNASLVTLIEFNPYLKPGDMILFDEFFSVSKAHHELRAFEDFQSVYNRSFVPFGKVLNGQFAIKLT